MQGSETRIIRGTTLGDWSEDSHEILVIIYGPQLGCKFDLGGGGDEVIIGRDFKADIQIDDDATSRLHCRLQRTDEGWRVEDLDSTNGTYVQGIAVQRVDLRDGDLLKIGGSIFKYLAASNIEASYHEEIYRLAIYDGLTQIRNRRYFEEFTEREISRSLRHDRSLSLILFDVDHFKSVNDQHGHLSGDHVLRHLALTLRPRIRREELFARYAGDEFVVVLPESSLKSALRFAETLRGLVDATEFVFEGQELTVTISVGVATLGSDIVTPAQLVAAADAALYRAKEAGRNAVAS